MMTEGAIRRLALDRVESRDDARLSSAWIRRNAPARTLADGAWLTRAAPRSLPGRAPVLGLLGADGAKTSTALLAHASSGARVYLVVGADWGRNQSDSALLQAPRVLVRRVPEVPATGVLAGDLAWLRLGACGVLRLDATQAEALRHTFLRLFWHDATEETWSGGRQLVWRPARERPFDVPDVPGSAAVRCERADARLSGDPRGALLHVTGGAPPEPAPRRLWFPAGPEHQDRLSRLVDAGTEILWDDLGLPDALVSATGGEILFPGTRARLRLRLTNAQAGEVGRVLEGDAAWRFQTDVRLGDASHRQASLWLPGEAASRALEPEQRIDLGDVLAISLRAVPETTPASFPAAQPLALAVRYHWTSVPPRVPDGEEDPLIGRWRRLDEEWSARLGRVREQLASADGDRGRIGQLFSKLVGAMLGFQRTHGGLTSRLAEMESQRPSTAGPAGAPTLLARLVEIEEQARKLQGELDEAERKAREDAEREKQEAEWRARVDAASRSLVERRDAAAAAEARRGALAEEVRGIEDALKSADKAARKDLEVKQRKLADDLQRAHKEFGRLRGEVAALEQQVAERFEFRPPTAPGARPGPSGGRFVPSASAPRAGTPVPEEAPPEVGALRNHKGQRYLVIKVWEELAAGEQTAARLSARLVAPEEA